MFCHVSEACRLRVVCELIFPCTKCSENLAIASSKSHANRSIRCYTLVATQASALSTGVPRGSLADSAGPAATAASLWATGAMGMAAGLGSYDVAILISVVTWLTLWLFSPLRAALRADVDDGFVVGGGCRQTGRVGERGARVVDVNPLHLVGGADRLLRLEVCLGLALHPQHLEPSAVDQPARTHRVHRRAIPVEARREGEVVLGEAIEL